MDAVEQPSDSLVGPTMLWCGVQLLTLTIATAHFPLWLAEPKPVEQFALHVVAIEQLILAALFSPLICGTLARSVATALISIAFILFAGVAAGATNDSVANVACFNAEWVTVLALAHSIFNGTTFRSVVGTVATLVVVGSPTLQYLASEFQPATSYHQAEKTFDLTAAVVDFASNRPSYLPHLTLLSTLFAFAVVTVAVRRQVQRQVIHTGLQQ